MSSLILKRAAASRPSGEWNQDDFDVLADSVVVGRIMKAAAAPVGSPWMWTLAFGHHEDRTPTHGYEATREAALAAFAESWRGRSAVVNGSLMAPECNALTGLAVIIPTRKAGPLSGGLCAGSPWQTTTSLAACGPAAMPWIACGSPSRTIKRPLNGKQPRRAG
jgi:hypothetical protein